MTAAESLAARTAVAKDRLRILRILQRRSESIADVATRVLLVGIAEEVQQAPIQLEGVADATT